MNTKRIKLLVNLVTVLALVVLIIVSRAQIGEAFTKLADLNYFWLLMIIPLQLINYSSVAKFYQTYLRNLNIEIRFKELLKVALEMNFVNNVFPSGGVSGFGYFGLRMRKLGVPTSKATLTQVMRHTLTFFSFIFYMVVALLLVTFVGNASRFIVLVSSSLITLILIGTAAILYIISSSNRVRKFTAFLPRVFNYSNRRVLRGMLPRINVERIERLFEQLHHDYKTINQDWRLLKKPFLWTLIMNLSELLTVTVVYFAFGETVNFGAIIIAYAVANLAGMVAILPGGIGVYEGLMTAVLAAAGIPKALALSATLVYRVLNLSLFLPVGFLLYQLNLRQKSTAETGDG